MKKLKDYISFARRREGERKAFEKQKPRFAKKSQKNFLLKFLY